MYNIIKLKSEVLYRVAAALAYKLFGRIIVGSLESPGCKSLFTSKPIKKKKFGCLFFTLSAYFIGREGGGGTFMSDRQDQFSIRSPVL